MNSDDLQKIEAEITDEDGTEFNPYEFVLETRLTDEPDGGLFGVRF